MILLKYSPVEASLRRHNELLAAGVDDVLFEHEWDLVAGGHRGFNKIENWLQSISSKHLAVASLNSMPKIDLTLVLTFQYIDSEQIIWKRYILNYKYVFKNSFITFNDPFLFDEHIDTARFPRVGPFRGDPSETLKRAVNLSRAMWEMNILRTRLMLNVRCQTGKDERCRDGSKPWYLVNHKIAGKWMFIPLKCIYRY